MTNVSFEEHQMESRPRPGTSRMTRLVMRLSGGAVKTESAANAVLLIVAAVCIIAAIVILTRTF